MSLTGMPAVFSALALPPVDRSSTPKARSARAKSRSPFLSETDSNARAILLASVIRRPLPLVGARPRAARLARNRGWQQAPLNLAKIAAARRHRGPDRRSPQAPASAKPAYP